MKMIKVENPDNQQLDEVSKWPVWSNDSDDYEWDYTEKEMFYILEGSAELSIQDSEKVTIKSGDLVTVEKGVLVHWLVTEKIRKHYKFFK